MSYDQPIYSLPPYEPKPGEAYMCKEQRDYFRKLLINRKSLLLQGGNEAIIGLQENTEILADVSDQATREEAVAVDLRKRDREYKLIQKIDSAIQRIDNKKYGYCDECGIEIGIRRLEARPTAELCIDCKSLDEVREKQRR
jgi:DnaK suppressor protein